MMDTDTACARQQVMLRAKYRGDKVFLEKRQKEREEGRDRREEERFWFPVHSTHSPSSVGT